MNTIFRVDSLYVLIAIGLILVGSLPASAQPELWTDAHLRQQAGDAPVVPGLRSGVPDTLVISASDPFFDDFSYASSLPDTNRWFVPDIDFRVPAVVRNSALEAPTPGTLRFDGLRRNGTPYETLSLLSGPTDRLVSHYLDISAWGPGDNIWLYLYLEAGGRCEAPESRDSITIHLITPSDSFLLATVKGNQTNGSWLAIPMDSLPFFSPLSQLVLESYGSQNGMLDVWLVDYLYLGPEWSGGVSNPNDRSPVRLLSSPIEPYFCLPQAIYQQGNNWQKIHDIVVNNQAFAPLSGNLYSEWSSQQVPPSSPYFHNVSVSVPANSSASVSIPASTTQNPQQVAKWQSISYLTNNVDRFAGNDTLKVEIGIDSLMGYDDGIADGTYGLNKSLGFGLQFELPSPDSVEAVWMHFSPLVFANSVNGKITYLENKVFRLRFWNAPHPDSFFVEQVAGMEVSYTADGQFVRFPLSQPTRVPTTFWVGLQQLDDIPIGIGFDASYDRDAYAYWDSLGNWTNTSLNGCPMIRLEFKTDNQGQISGIPAESLVNRSTVFVSPNPISANQILSIHLPPHIDTYTGELVNLQGQSIHATNSDYPGNQLNMAIPSEIPRGLYLWRHNLEINGQTSILLERLVIR